LVFAVDFISSLWAFTSTSTVTNFTPFTRS
jgi:hypothetical protein